MPLICSIGIAISGNGIVKTIDEFEEMLLKHSNIPKGSCIIATY